MGIVFASFALMANKKRQTHFELERDFGEEVGKIRTENPTSYKYSLYTLDCIDIEMCLILMCFVNRDNSFLIDCTTSTHPQHS